MYLMDAVQVFNTCVLLPAVWFHLTASRPPDSKRLPAEPSHLADQAGCYASTDRAEAYTLECRSRQAEAA
jgi:hypothetical protein